MKRTLGLVLGWGLVLLGIVGLFLPVLQGVALIALGIVVLSRHSALVRRGVAWARKRFPWLERALDRIHRSRGTEDENGPGEAAPPDRVDQSITRAGTKIGSPEVSSTTEP